MKVITDPLLEQAIMLPLLVTQAAKSMIYHHLSIKSQLEKIKIKVELQNAEFAHLCKQHIESKE
jgi:hypothetical protein